MRHDPNKTPAPALHYSAASRIKDVADQSRLIRDWSLRYDQLSRGSFEGHLREAWVEGVQLFKEELSQAVFQSGHARPDSICFGVFEHLSGEARWQGEQIGIDHVMCMYRGSELQVSTPQSSTLLSISIPLQLLDEELAEPPRSTRHAPAQAQFLRQRIGSAIAVLAEHPLQLAKQEARKQFLSDLSGLVIHCIAGEKASRKLSRDKARQVVGKAQKFVFENAGEPITVTDLCAQTHTSRRTLQECFEQVVGESPGAFLKIVRLNAVRRDLQRCNTQHSIADIASSWGFWHLSQFAADYRRLFNELPSMTAQIAGRQAHSKAMFASS